jgi:hypothetical protein
MKYTLSIILIVHKPLGFSSQLCTLINGQFLKPSVDLSCSRSVNNVVSVPEFNIT